MHVKNPSPWKPTLFDLTACKSSTIPWVVSVSQFSPPSSQLDSSWNLSSITLTMFPARRRQIDDKCFEAYELGSDGYLLEVAR